MCLADFRFAARATRCPTLRAGDQREIAVGTTIQVAAFSLDELPAGRANTYRDRIWRLHLVFVAIVTRFVNGSAIIPYHDCPRGPAAHAFVVGAVNSGREAWANDLAKLV